MLKKNISPILALSVILFLVSCAKEGPTGPTGPYGPSFTGNISGHVILYDKYGSEVLTGLSTVQLTLSSASTLISIPTTTYALTTGAYTYTGVTTGNYSIAATDTAISAGILYGATTVNDIDFLSGTLNQDIKLSRVPDSFLVSFYSGEKSDSLNDSLVIQATADTRVRNCIVFANSTPTAIGYLLNYIVTIPANTTSVSQYVPRQDLYNVGFVKGSKVYYLAYSYVVNDGSVYEDPVSGKNVYNAVYPVPLVDSAQVP